MAIRFATQQVARTVVRRGAFDIGSGATKVQVADVDVSNRRVLDEIYGEERPIPFGYVAISSGSMTLSDEIMETGMNTIRELMENAKEKGATDFSAVATEVFRKASNGQEYISMIEAEFGFPVSVVTQQSEGELGFNTALAYSATDAGAICSWDSGAASFQIVSQDPMTKELRYYLGALGTSPVTALLVETVRGQELSSDLKERPAVNPVCVDEAEALVEMLIEKLDVIPAWLQAKEQPKVISAIGGNNCIFRLASDLRGEGHEKPLSQADIYKALQDCCNKTGEELQPLFDFDYADHPRIAVPKLALLWAVTKHLDLKAIQFHPCVGSCAGLLVSEDYWNGADGRHVS